jgi:hypothetical protein
MVNHAEDEKYLSGLSVWFKKWAMQDILLSYLYALFMILWCLYCIIHSYFICTLLIRGPELYEKNSKQPGKNIGI